MKKILFVSPTGTMDNGAEISIFNLMKFLVSQGFTVFNVAPQHHHSSQIEYYDLCTRNGISTHFIPVMRWWWEDAPGDVTGSQEDRAFFYRDNITKIREIIVQYEIDLVITNTVNMFQGAVAAACENVPHFWLIHEFPSGEFAYYLDKIKFIKENSDKVYAVQGKLQENLSKIFSPFPVGTFVPYTELKVSELKNGKKSRIISVGRLTERKNQLELIKGFEKLDIPEMELVFVGNGDETYKSKCDDYIREKRLKNIKFIGNLDNPWEIFTDQDICVLPSAMETFGLVYVESLLNGIPVIFSNNPGFKSAHSIFNFGYMYELGNVKQLAKLIERVKNNLPAEKSKSMNYVLHAKKIYSIENVYQEILEDISDLPSPKEKVLSNLAGVLTLNEETKKISYFLKRIKNLKNKCIYKIKNKIKKNR